MLYILYGEDDFSLKEALTDLKKGEDDEEIASLSTSFLNGRTTPFPELRDLCDTVPFLSPKRLVIVEGLLSSFDPRREGREGPQPPASLAEKEEQWKGLADYVKTMPETTLLILTDGPLAPQNALLKLLAPVANVREFRPVKGSALERWIRDRVENEGGKIAPRAVRLLVDLVGENLWAMSKEVEKLLLFSPGRPIQEADVQAVVSQAREASIFSLIDAIALGGLPGAARLLHQLLDDGAAPPYLLFMITRQFRFLILAQELEAHGTSPSEMGKRLGLHSDYALKKTIEQAQRYTMPKLEGIFQKLLEADLAIKTGKGPPELALDLLVAELCR